MRFSAPFHSFIFFIYKSPDYFSAGVKLKLASNAVNADNGDGFHIGDKVKESGLFYV